MTGTTTAIPQKEKAPARLTTGDLAWAGRRLVRKGINNMIPVAGHVGAAALRGWMCRRFSEVPAHLRENLEATFGEGYETDEVARRHLAFSKKVRLMRTLPLHSGTANSSLWPAEGLEHLDTALARERGAILVTAHLGYPRLVVPILRAHDYDAVQLVAGRKNLIERKQRWNGWASRSGRVRRYLFDRLMAGFIRPHDIVASLDVRPIFEALDHNRAIMIAGDGFHSSEFVNLPLLDRLYPFPVGFMKIAMMSEAPVLPVFVIEDGGRTGIRLEVKPALPVDGKASIRENLSGFARALDDQLRETPHLWFRWSVQSFFERATAWAEMSVRDRWDRPFTATFGGEAE